MGVFVGGALNLQVSQGRSKEWEQEKAGLDWVEENTVWVIHSLEEGVGNKGKNLK
jgi:hypothetical protein